MMSRAKPEVSRLNLSSKNKPGSSIRWMKWLVLIALLILVLLALFVPDRGFAAHDPRESEAGSSEGQIPPIQIPRNFPHT
jgi:hypothetical protein